MSSTINYYGNHTVLPHREVIKNIGVELAVMAIHFVFFFILAVWLDYRRTITHKGVDGRRNFEDRLQLAEGQDVLAHKQYASQVWESSEN